MATLLMITESENSLDFEPGKVCTNSRHHKYYKYAFTAGKMDPMAES
jgi:hypothetical protein